MFFLLFLFICIVILVIWITLSVILSSNIVYYTKNKISTFIAFPFSAFLILFIASLFTFGWGWLVPYAIQPSYYEFKKMCELNKLPNNEEKYNKMLAYFGKSLDTLDWEELNKKITKLEEGDTFYRKDELLYTTETNWKQINHRTEMVARFLSNESVINRYNIKAMYFVVVWYTRDYHLGTRSVASYELEWKEDDLSCGETTGFNLQVEGSK